MLTVLDSDGELMRPACAPAPTWSPPTWPRPRRAVGHEFNDADDLALGLAGLIEMGAGEAIITSETGCVAIVGEGPSGGAWR